MKCLNTVRHSKKMQFVIVVIISAILFLVGLNLQGQQLTSELPTSEPGSNDAVYEQAQSVADARDNYLAAIGKGNGGAYDQYQSAIQCTENLDLRLETLKEARNDLQRIIQEIAVREREMRTQRSIEYLESLRDGTDFDSVLDDQTKYQLNEVWGKIEKIQNEVFAAKDLAAIEQQESDLRLAYEQATQNFDNCFRDDRDLEKCETELETWIQIYTEYEKFILNLENLTTEKALELEVKLAPLEAEIEEIIYGKAETSSVRFNTELISAQLNKLTNK